MKKLFFLAVLGCTFLLAGCATYTFRKGESPYDKGYVAARYDRVLPEYTIGKDNSVPAEEKLARERFQRRRKEVESYYKKMGYIENRFRQNFIDPPVFIFKTVIGIFKLPAIAINDYKYNHDPKYKEKMDQLDDAEYKAEKERIKALKDRLNSYIQEDLKKEAGVVSVEPKPQAAVVVKEKPEVTPTPPPAEIKEPAKPETKEPIKAESVVEKPVRPASLRGSEAPKAVIIAKPQKGLSPLFVQFNGSKSTSPNARIVSYSWDFGDGDTSAKKNPSNTYWSTTYGSRRYTATLTVKDNKGNSAATSTEIEVITK